MMRGCVPFLLAAAAAAWGLAPSSAQEESVAGASTQDGAGPDGRPGAGLRGGTTPAADYRPVPLRGFDVRVHPALGAGGDQAALGLRALDALERDLAAVVDQVPAAALAHLRAVPLYLGVSDPVAPCACYHPSPDWLRQNGYDPAKAKAVEIASAATYLAWRGHQPSMVLHELAHAYHDRVHRGADGTLARHLVAAREAGRYDRVLRASGKLDRHYAMTNGDEFFAETTEALLGVNDFFPFVRAELLAHDPEGARLVAELWGVELPEPAQPAEEPATASLEDLARADVQRLRDTVGRWLSGRATLAEFERFEEALAPGFVVVNRAGRVVPRDEMLRTLRAAGGERELGVETRVLRVERVAEDHALVVFEERQLDPADRRVLVTSVLLARDGEVPGGVRWLHAHESVGAR